MGKEGGGEEGGGGEAEGEGEGEGEEQARDEGGYRGGAYEANLYPNDPN